MTLQAIWAGFSFGIGFWIAGIFAGCFVTLLLVAWDGIRDQSRPRQERELFEMREPGK